MSHDARRVLQWIRVAGRVRYEKEGRRYRVSSERHKQVVFLTLAELRAVQKAAGAIWLETMGAE